MQVSFLAVLTILVGINDLHFTLDCKFMSVEQLTFSITARLHSLQFCSSCQRFSATADSVITSYQNVVEFMHAW